MNNKERLIKGVGVAVVIVGGGYVASKAFEDYRNSTPAPIITPDTSKTTVDAKTLDLLNKIDERLAGLEVKNPTSTITATVATTGTVASTAARPDVQGTTTVTAIKSEATSAPIKGVLVPAERSGTGWVLQHPDGDKTEVRQLPDGFTPDRSLNFATDIKSLEIGSDLKIFSDWETALNTKRPDVALAGYGNQQNDWCPTVDFKCNVQADMYAWSTYQGSRLEVPGIGILEGGPRRSVVLNVLNLGDSVYAWDAKGHGQMTQERGFRATGRIFDGEKNVDVLERNLSGHWAFRQFFGTPEKSYIGITDSPDNALEVLMVSVQRKQWGNNPDGSKRMEFQLIRAEMLKGK